MRKNGFTLLELMMAVAILMIVMGTLFSISLAFANSADVQESKITTIDEVRRGFMFLTPLLRQASRSSINWGALPGDSIRFRVPGDIPDGSGNRNGFAVDSHGEIQLLPEMTIQRDVDDINGDGKTMCQLVIIGAGALNAVLANDLQDSVAPIDLTASGGDIPDGVGFWVVPRDGGLEITIRSQRTTRRQHVLTTTATEFIIPRNN